MQQFIYLTKISTQKNRFVAFKRKNRLHQRKYSLLASCKKKKKTREKQNIRNSM